MVERQYENEPVFDDDAQTTVLDGGAPPPNLDAQVSAAIAGTVTQPAELTVPPDTSVRLPGGLEQGADIIRDAEVRELNGEDEEALMRASQSTDPLKYFKTLLERGTVSVGGVPATPHVLRDLLMGDRETLILGIRRATFGDDVEIEDFYCPHCQDTMDITVKLDEIPIQDLEGPRKFEVPLRKGGVALVKLPTGHDQENVMSHKDLSVAEQNTILLSRCVEQVTGPTGKVTQIAGSTAQVNRLGVADRREILKQFAERQPGPRYDEVTVLHEPCDKELPVVLTVVSLFRGL